MDNNNGTFNLVCISFLQYDVILVKFMNLLTMELQVYFSIGVPCPHDVLYICFHLNIYDYSNKHIVPVARLEAFRALKLSNLANKL